MVASFFKFVATVALLSIVTAHPVSHESVIWTAVPIPSDHEVPIPEASYEPVMEPSMEPTIEPIMEETMEPGVEGNTGSLFPNEPSMEPSMVPVMEETMEPGVEGNNGSLFPNEPSMEPTMEPTTMEETMEPGVQGNSGSLIPDDHAKPAHSDAPCSPPKKQVCFWKKQQCCYKYSICHKKVKVIKYYKPVSVKKCVDKYEKKCAKIPKTEKKKECKLQTVYEKPKYCIVQWFGMCKPKAVEKEVCCDKYVTKYVKICKQVPKKVCKMVTAYQVIIKKVVYVTYCPKLRCGKLEVEGKVHRPMPYTKDVVVDKVKAELLHKKPVDIDEYKH